MNGSKKKKTTSYIVFFLVISMPFIIPINMAQERNYQKTEIINTYISEISEKNGSYIVGIGPVGAKSSKECNFVSELSESQVQNLKNELFSVGNHSDSTVDLIQRNVELLEKYGILPTGFYENLTDFFTTINEEEGEKHLTAGTLSKGLADSPKIRFGPTIFFYASFMSQYTFIDDPTNQIVPFFNITRLNEFLKGIFNIDNPVFDFTENVSCGYYSKFTTWQIGIGGSISIFASAGPLPNQNYHFYGPFLGVFIFPVTLLGIYIFNEKEDPHYPGGSFEIPYLDIMIGMPLVFSLVLPGWYVDPDNFE